MDDLKQRAVYHFHKNMLVLVEKAANKACLMAGLKNEIEAGRVTIYHFNIFEGSEELIRAEVRL